MRDISIDEPNGTLPVHTYLVYGDTRAGKTVFAATFPRPLIIADVGEGGYTSIRTMDRGTWFEADQPPIIKGVENMNDLSAFLPELRALVACKRVLTVVHDAFSFYADFFLTKIVQNQGGSPDMREAYGQLGQHLRKLRTEYHALGVNVVWNCLAKHPEKDVPKGRPLIPGQEADKFAAAVTFLLYARVEQHKHNNVITQEHQIRTRQYGAYIAGNREGIYADNLPDPFVGSYADFLTALGYDPDDIRAKLPKPTAPVKVAAPAPPPVTKPAATKPSTPGASPKASGTK